MYRISLAIALVSVALCFTYAVELSPEYYLRINIPSHKELIDAVQELSEMGVSLERVKRTQDFVEGYITEDGLEGLSKNGYEFEVRIVPKEQQKDRARDLD